MSDWSDHLERLRDAEDRQAIENMSLGRNFGARGPSGFGSPVFWGMIGAILGGILGRGLIGALVGGAFAGGGFYILKRAVTFDETHSDRITILRWALLGALVGIVAASVIGGVSVILSIGLGTVLGSLIGRSRFAR